MARFKGFAVTVMVGVGMVLIAVAVARAGDLKPVKVAGRKTPPVYTVEQPLPGPRMESILTDTRSAAAAMKEGTGWLVHYGTKRDNCARADATSGLRVMCVAW